MRFTELDFDKQTLAGISSAGFTECMPVQETALPVSLTGSDIMVQSKTGSGKTAVFILTFLEEYLKHRRSRCLIIAPTRELAQQIEGDAKVLASGIPEIRCGCFYGGVGYDRQVKLLKQGCTVNVGTPGRLLEFMQDGSLDPKSIDTFVIDEADRMFDMGFYHDIKKIFRMLPDRTKRQTMLFSATLEVKVRELAWEYMNEPQVIELEPDTVTVDKISQELYHVAKSEKFTLFLQLLAVAKPSSALVFTNSRHITEELAARLRYNGYRADYISGELSQRERDTALKNLKEGAISILVATDVAARGLQIDNLPLVVNYDVPEDYENYVHRIGRTARAGKSGRAITLADEEFVYGLEAIENYIKMKIPVIWPENLPEVTDLSVGKSWKIRGNGKGLSNNSHSTDKLHNTKQQKQKIVRKDVVRPTENKSVHKVPARRNLGSMTEEERIAYYKERYGFIEKKVQPEKKHIEPALKDEDAKDLSREKKPGFFARLFRRFK
ncbi:MAG: DEAD/DEAH box helicase [Sphaerochaetaceae bacterium]|nr:DEAD/DEAH box helicase [Sphaerochaetaceae bacterium]